MGPALQELLVGGIGNTKKTSGWPMVPLSFVTSCKRAVVGHLWWTSQGHSGLVAWDVAWDVPAEVKTGLASFPRFPSPWALSLVTATQTELKVPSWPLGQSVHACLQLSSWFKLLPCGTWSHSSLFVLFEIHRPRVYSWFCLVGILALSLFCHV